MNFEKPSNRTDSKEYRLLELARNGIDTEARFKLADHLMAIDSADERAELIMLPRRIEATSDAVLMRRYLELLAKIGVGWLDNDDEEQILIASGGGCAPVQYDLMLDDFMYYVRYRHGYISISDALSTSLDFFEGPYSCLEYRYVADGGEWTDEETNALLFEVSSALRLQRPHQHLPPNWRDCPTSDLRVPQLELTLPEHDLLRKHPRFRKGPYPKYVAPSCGWHHKHDLNCMNWTIRPHDFETFYAVEAKIKQ